MREAYSVGPSFVIVEDDLLTGRPTAHPFELKSLFEDDLGCYLVDDAAMLVLGDSGRTQPGVRLVGGEPLVNQRDTHARNKRLQAAGRECRQRELESTPAA